MKKEGKVNYICLLENKKGLSTIITTLLLILLTIVAIAIIWTLVRVFIEKESEKSAIKAYLLAENIDITNAEVDQNNNLNLSITIQKRTGKIITQGSIEIQGQSPQVDVMSVVDLSESMSVCNFVNQTCCTASLNSAGNAIWRRHFMSYTWGSCTGEFTTCDWGFNDQGPHWATLDFSTPQNIDNVTIWWGWNNYRGNYMVSQQIDIQYWDGSSYQTIAAHNIVNDNVSNSSYTFSSVSTTSIRLWQQENMGWIKLSNPNINYTESMWLSEIELGSVDTSLASVSVSSMYIDVNNSVGGQGHHKNTLIDGINDPHSNPLPEPSPPLGECGGVSTASINSCQSTCNTQPVLTSIMIDKIRPAQTANKALISSIFTGANNRVGFSIFRNAIDTTSSNNLVDNSGSGTLNSKIDSWEAYTPSSCMCCGINDATSKLTPSTNPQRVMIVMSDGDSVTGCALQGVTGDLNNDGIPDTGRDDAIKAACDANASIQNLTIHAIGVGAGVDKVTMQEIANCGGGNFSFSPYGDVTDLTNIYQTIANQFTQKTQSVHNYNFLRFVFFDSSSNTAVVDKPAPEILQVTKYDFDLTTSGLVAPIIKVEIYPIVILSSGEEFAGTLLETWNF